jgi:RNA polymerase sigma factor (sigma-70 family)
MNSAITNITEPTVFVVDDDEAVRSAMRMLIKSSGLAVQTFASATEFLDTYEPTTPGCLVLDLRMPGLSGLELQEELNKRRITLPLIVVTGHGNVPMAVRAVKRGAVDFLEKPFDDQVLLQRIEQAIELDGRRRKHHAEQRAVVERIARLSPREREVMELLVEGLGNKEIALELGLSRKTVDIHRSHVMMKLGVDSLAELVRMGLTQKESDSAW